MSDDSLLWHDLCEYEFSMIKDLSTRLVYEIVQFVDVMKHDSVIKNAEEFSAKDFLTCGLKQMVDVVTVLYDADFSEIDDKFNRHSSVLVQSKLAYDILSASKQMECCFNSFFYSPVIPHDYEDKIISEPGIYINFSNFDKSIHTLFDLVIRQLYDFICNFRLYNGIDWGYHSICLDYNLNRLNNIKSKKVMKHNNHFVSMDDTLDGFIDMMTGCDYEDVINDLDTNMTYDKVRDLALIVINNGMKFHNIKEVVNAQFRSKCENKYGVFCGKYGEDEKMGRNKWLCRPLFTCDTKNQALTMCREFVRAVHIYDINDRYNANIFYQEIESGDVVVINSPYDEIN